MTIKIECYDIRTGEYISSFYEYLDIIKREKDYFYKHLIYYGRIGQVIRFLKLYEEKELRNNNLILKVYGEPFDVSNKNYIKHQYTKE